MVKIVHAGPFKYRLASWQSLARISAGVMFRRMLGNRLVASWSAEFEIGVLFWREQFRRAFAFRDIANGRLYFDSLQTYTDEVFEVKRKKTQLGSIEGDWITPITVADDVVILYLHGGGYTFNCAVTHRFADTLACLLERRVFFLHYRPTPEHQHPAQLEDAMAAYRYLLDSGLSAEKIVIIGDSAGGHQTLLSLLSIRDAGLPQPALAVGLCAWTDTRRRGASFLDNDRYDLVQGYMALKFGEWLCDGSGYSHKDISPIYLDFSNCAPIYMQAGSHEIFHDMIKQFAEKLAEDQHETMLDVWPDMVHNFHAHGQSIPASSQAFARLNEAIEHFTSDALPANGFSGSEFTQTNSMSR